MDEFDFIHSSLNQPAHQFHSLKESKRISSFTKKRRWATKMKHCPTKAESAMWRILRRLKPRRQYVLFGYIADFAFLKSKFIVEVDGSSHIGREDYDKCRDAAFKKNGWTTLRFTNEQVLANDPIILEEVKKLLKPRKRKRGGSNRPKLGAMERFIQIQRDHEERARILRESTIHWHTKPIV